MTFLWTLGSKRLNTLFNAGQATEFIQLKHIKTLILSLKKDDPGKEICIACVVWRSTWILNMLMIEEIDFYNIPK